MLLNNGINPTVSGANALTLGKDALRVSVTVPSGDGILTTAKNVVLAPFRWVKNIFTGGTPATPSASTTTGQVSTTAQTTTTGATPATETVTNTVGSTVTKVSSGQKLKDVMDEVLPKPEPFSMNVLGKQMLRGVIFGVVFNGIKSGIYIATGQWSGGQAWQYTLRDTIKGAVGGAGFGLGLGLTTMALTPLGIGGIPLTIAAMAGGALASFGSLQLLSMYSGWDWGYI